MCKCYVKINSGWFSQTFDAAPFPDQSIARDYSRESGLRLIWLPCFYDVSYQNSFASFTSSSFSKHVNQSYCFMINYCICGHKFTAYCYSAPHPPTPILSDGFYLILMSSSSEVPVGLLLCPNRGRSGLGLKEVEGSSGSVLGPALNYC